MFAVHLHDPFRETRYYLNSCHIVKVPTHYLPTEEYKNRNYGLPTVKKKKKRD